MAGIILSFTFCLAEKGGTGILPWLGSALAPIFLLAPLFLFKVLGAGDIKLFSVVGGFLGIHFVILSMGIAFFVAAILSVVRLIRYKQVLSRFSYLREYIHSMIQINCFKIIPYYEVKRDGYAGVIHFSPAILTAVLILIIFRF